MVYDTSWTAVAVFLFFVLSVLGLSFYFGSKAKSTKGYYTAHGQIHWAVNGVAFAGDYLSAASFLGICGMIAFYGYDGFLYSIGYLAGWVVALFVVAEPLKRLGKFTFADALNHRFNSRGIHAAAALSTLAVSLFYLIPQMVGAGALVRPLLGLPYYAGVLIVGGVVIVIVATAGMVSTTYVQFIKGSLLVIFCAMLTIAILARGLSTDPSTPDRPYHHFRVLPAAQVLNDPSVHVLPPEAGWTGKPYVRVERDGIVEVWRQSAPDAGTLSETQTLTQTARGVTLVNGRPQRLHGQSGPDLYSVGHLSQLPDQKEHTGPVGPLQFLDYFRRSQVVLWGAEKIAGADGALTTVYYQKPTAGADVLVPGASPTFAGLRQGNLPQKLDFISLMLALFCGTASLPHILIRYYTVKDHAAVRKSTLVGIATIGFFYILTLYLGLGAMVSGALDPTNNNMAAPLLARSFGELPFAIISAIAFTTVLGTVSGLILAGSGAVAHDIMTNLLGLNLSDQGRVRAGKIAAVGVGVVAMVLGILFEKMNVSFLVGWAFNVAASANLPALVMLLFWPRTTKRGVVASILVGMASSLGWILLSGDVYKNVYGLPAASAPMPFSQPGLVTIPLSFIVLVVVSLLTQPKAEKRG